MPENRQYAFTLLGKGKGEILLYLGLGFVGDVPCLVETSVTILGLKIDLIKIGSECQGRAVSGRWSALANPCNRGFSGILLRLAAGR